MKHKVVIFVEGGLIQQIEADIGLDLAILDYDTEGEDEEGIKPVRDTNGTVNNAYVTRWSIKAEPAFVTHFFNQVNGEPEREMIRTDEYGQRV